MNLPALRPARIGVLLNPRSGRVRRHPQRYQALLGRLPATQVAQVSTAPQIDAAIMAWGLGDKDLLIVVGGDGTLQAALTSLLREAGTRLPQVLIVPAGTTNMSATAMGVRGNPAKIIRALDRWLHQGTRAPGTQPRAVLQVMDSGAGAAQCGMFFGAGAIVTGVRYFHAHIKPTGLRGVAGPLTALARMVLALFSRKGRHLLPTVSATITVPQARRQAPWLLVLATTLDTLLMGSTPFWGTEKAAMRLTAISQQPGRLCRALPSVWSGRPSTAMRQDSGYLSHNVEGAGIEHLREYLLDGEIFNVVGTLALTTSTPVCFIIP
ncbi:diacylglycerol kinase family protein [Pseudomonas sp. RIT-To-2]|uniref:diacylglycerol kinase family protein n=1 Tax=Pseudomonas sp. RIT-To-2 TaxID=3462541 RepID=UPI0024131602